MATEPGGGSGGATIPLDAAGGVRHHPGMRGSWGYRAVAVGAAGAVVLSAVLGQVLDRPGPGRSLATLAFFAPMVAAVTALWWRRPDHRVAQGLLLFAAVNVWFDAVARVAINAGAELLAVFVPVTNGLAAAATVAFLWVVLVLPDGTYAARWHRRAVQVTLAGVLGALAVEVAARPELRVPAAVAEWTGADHVNPLHLPALASLAPVAMGVIGVSDILLFPVVGLLLWRYRRADAEQRLQLRLIVAALVGAAIIHAASVVAIPDDADAATRSLIEGVAALVSVVLVMGAISIAVLRYRLLDVQLILRRSVVYGAVWALTGAATFGVVAALGMAATTKLPVAAAVAVTMAVTLGVQPLRRRLNALAGRRLFGARPTSYELLAGFGQAIEHAFDVTQLAPEVATAVRTGVDARWVRITLNGADTAHPVLEAVAADGIALDESDPAALVVPIEHAGELVGAIECGPRAEGSYGATETELLTNLARQAGLAVRNARLAAELSARLDEIERQAAELASSRARLVAAQDAERRRIERDIHDGVQQGLASLLAKLRLARNQMARSPDVADATLAELQAEARATLDDLRRLAHGIHPPILTDRGLLEAVEAMAARLPIGVRIENDDGVRDRRFPQAIEAAAYFFVSEALTNVVKHAGTASAVVRLHHDSDGLQVVVEDDGPGFVPADAAGSGLTGMRDRIEAVGGSVRVSSAPGAGTHLAARLPLRSPAGTGV